MLTIMVMREYRCRAISYPQFTNHRIYIGYCKAENNPGDPTELKNHSGNGIVVGFNDQCAD